MDTTYSLFYVQWLSETQNKRIFYPILPYPILSYPILSYPILSYPILSHPILSYLILPYPIPSYLILSYPILSYTILSHPIQSYPILNKWRTLRDPKFVAVILDLWIQHVVITAVFTCSQLKTKIFLVELCSLLRLPGICMCLAESYTHFNNSSVDKDTKHLKSAYVCESRLPKNLRKAEIQLTSRRKSETTC
jgi:hypothetical protein